MSQQFKTINPRTPLLNAVDAVILENPDQAAFAKTDKATFALLIEKVRARLPDPVSTDFASRILAGRL